MSLKSRVLLFVKIWKHPLTQPGPPRREEKTIKSNQLYWLTGSGTVRRLKPIIKEATKDSQGTGRAMPRPVAA